MFTLTIQVSKNAFEARGVFHAAGAVKNLNNSSYPFWTMCKPLHVVYTGILRHKRQNHIISHFCPVEHIRKNEYSPRLYFKGISGGPKLIRW